ncbi:DEAD/DEAH box helicase family protein [Bacteroides caecimuris]|uniref:type I restriction endonuclease subunit R n=1 Tax=Bacteroides caecimuris TaxID=1796613 RepID=UPI002573FBAA|nr:DEAD/DEAH box helicase family protein [Bacteroides caecimuris]
MKNFDILKDVKGLGTVYQHCATAEEFQTSNPMISAHSARLALETMVKIIYRLKDWTTKERPTLLELTTDERFRAFVDSPEMMKRIHYIRKIGNNASHVGGDAGYVGRRESFFAVLNLYYFVGSFALAWELIPELPPFDKTLLDQKETTHRPVITPKPEKIDAITTAEADTAAAAVAETTTAQPDTVEAQPIVNDLSEAETRRLYIDLLLREAGWKVTETEGEIKGGQAGIEIEVHGMPSESGVGYADYVLWDDDGTPLAVIEAKRTSVDPAKGRHQAELYAECLKNKYACELPVIYYTNGFQTNIIDGQGYPSRPLMGFHTREELRRMIAQRSRNAITDLTIDERITNRPYQKRVIQAVANHYNDMHRRALLVMATGTGKTRVSISMVELLVRNGWVKNVLFLADRIELVDQAKLNFTKLLPSQTVSSLREADCDKSARILFSTYQTMISHLDREDKTFSIGRFDLVIIDEAHRSVFGKYGAIFDYFDRLLLGLTATPRDEVDRSTYELFGMEQGIPTDSYEYQEAIDERWLVPFVPIIDNSQILTDGIDPDKLTPEEREQLKEIFEYEKVIQSIEGDYSRKISATEIFKYIFNQNTVDYVLTQLMENGYRVNDGTIIGKTIIFAYNHNHAVFIAERFAALYPDLGPDFCRVIDNYEKYSSDLIVRFKNPESLPQIAVSVDMLDTGIDVPEIVNLVFFKPVHSKIKFWQMIGRGTRLCPDLYGPGQDKKDFLIFDYYRNFEYFSVNADGAIPTKSTSVVATIFNLRTDLKYILQDASYQSDPDAKSLHDKIGEILHNQIKDLNRSRLDVRRQMKLVESLSQPEAMIALSLGDTMAMKENISPLFKNTLADASALKFDALCLKRQLALVDETVSAGASETQITTIARYLKEKKASIPQVMAKMDTIKAVLTSQFWNSLSLGSLEKVRVELRDLLQYIDGGKSDKTFTVNIEDTFKKDNSGISVTPPRTYRRRAEDYLREHLPNDPVLQKIYHLEHLSEVDIKRLEEIFWKELGTREEYDATTQRNPYRENVAAFIRSIIGIEQETAFEKYRELIHGAELTRMQEEYLRNLIRYVSENGDFRTKLLQSPPFNSFTTVFKQGYNSLIEYIKLISDVIAA